jgi:NAD(P)-dependent dehydrogenase (short-subunit alcohol dehydrogenase family)
MDLGLTGKHALVTGSTAGIGYAIAKGLAAEGASVVITGRTEAGVDAALTRLKGDVSAAKVVGIAADCATAEGAKIVFDRVPELDVLVNNLGIYGRKPAFEIDDGEWRRFFEVNVMSGIRFTRHYAPGMAKRGWGRVLFVSSESALNIPPEMIHYGMTKTAQLTIARGMAELTRGTGVTVNSVLPGPTRSEGIVDFIRSTVDNKDASDAELEAEFFTKMRPLSLIRRLIEADEIGAMVAFLASPLAATTNGAALRAEGGIVPTIA